MAKRSSICNSVITFRPLFSKIFPLIVYQYVLGFLRETRNNRTRFKSYGLERWDSRTKRGEYYESLIVEWRGSFNLFDLLEKKVCKNIIEIFIQFFFVYELNWFNLSWKHEDKVKYYLSLFYKYRFSYLKGWLFSFLFALSN